jgi:hypothetical protein
VTATQELADAVRARAQGTPYVVEETPEGFDVRLALEDPLLFRQLRGWRLVEASIHHVRTDEERRTCSVEDELRELTWRAGPDGQQRPTLGGRLAVKKGRVISKSVQRRYGAAASGIEERSEQRFDNTVGRRLVEDAARDLGWRQERGTSEKIGLYVAVAVVALLVLGGLVVGVLALAGRL